MYTSVTTFMLGHCLFFNYLKFGLNYFFIFFYCLHMETKHSYILDWIESRNLLKSSPKHNGTITIIMATYLVITMWICLLYNILLDERFWEKTNKEKQKQKKRKKWNWNEMMEMKRNETGDTPYWEMIWVRWLLINLC